MAGVSIDVSLNELDELAGDLGVLAGLFGDLRPLMGAIGEYGVSSTQERFRQQAGPGGEPWRPSIRATVEGGATLTESGRLRDSISHQVLGSADVAWGTNVIYGPIHQLGGTIRARNAPALKFRLPGSGWRTVEEVFMPARPFLGLDQTDEQSISELVAEHLSDVFLGL